VLIAAKTNSVVEALSQQFHDRTVAKEYLAIVVGTMEEEKRIASPIGRSRRHRQRMAVVPEGREAYTVARPMKADQLEEVRDGQCPEGYTLVHVLPRTGRTHQVRVHLASVGYPILGDAVYGNHDNNLRWEGLRQMLHCWKLTVTHPVTGERLSIRAPLPEDMRQVLTLRSF
jgi:23S rRNA pseudouridine1911/1915/1917 synthase